MAFQQYTADDRSPGALGARKFWTDVNTVKPATLAADGKKKSPFDLVSLSKNPELDALVSSTLKEGLAQKTEGVPSGGETFAALRGLADQDRTAGRNFLADYERRVGQDYGASQAAINRANQDAIDQSLRGMETYGLGRTAASGANIGVGTELARVAGQAAATARNPALLALANLDADRTNRLNAARMGTLGRDFALESNLANFGRDVVLDPQRQLSARLANLGAANAIERNLRFENVSGTFDVPGASAPRFGSSMYVPPIQRYNNPAVSRVGPSPTPVGGNTRRPRSAAEQNYLSVYGVYPDEDPGWANNDEAQNIFRLGGGTVAGDVRPGPASWTYGTPGTWQNP